MWSSGVEAGDGPPSSLQEEVLKDQFQQQQEKIAELKELLKQNEQKLMNKEKEVEQYATKLSDIKSRSKASKHKSAKQKQDSSEHELQVPETPMVGSHKEEISIPGRGNTEKMPKRNLVLLRKKLEENRLKFEQRGKEMSENKKSAEEMVQHLKTQLDERDLTIQELQRGLEATQSPARVIELQETKEHLTVSAESSSQTPEEVSSQIVYSDIRIMELNSRIAELEAAIIDLEENVREKDSVIEARTKAITLMSEDFSRRNKVTIDNLEETREEMRKMQNNFVLQEVKMKEENKRLKEELAAKYSSETKLVRYPELLPEYLDNVKESSLLMETYMLWGRKCHIFWEWMATVLAEKESFPQHKLISVHDRRTLLHVLDMLRHAAKARIFRCQRVRECENVTDKDNDGKFSAPLQEQSLPFMRGLPRCILEEKGKDTEMSLLLTDSEEQLQEVKTSYQIKRAAVLQKLHELAARIDNVVVLFPSSLK